MKLDKDPCECGHTRAEHGPRGCTQCECELRAPVVGVREDGTTFESWRQPFEKGHTVSTTHGAKSRRLISERAREVWQELREVAPWLEDADELAVGVLVDSLAKFRVVDDAIDAIIEGRLEGRSQNGPRTGVLGVPPYLWEQHSRAARQVTDALAKLGLSPKTRAALLKDAGYAALIADDVRAAGIRALSDQGRAILARRRTEELQ